MGQGAAGQSLVEFALAVPVLLLILFGALDFGRSVADFSALTNAAQEGARYSVLNAGPTISQCTNTDGITNCSAIINDAFSIAPLLDKNNITSFSMVYTHYPLGDPTGTLAAKVFVQYKFTPVTGFVVGGATITLSASGVYLQQ
jgi:hypothetical protein